jgi:putative DNA primase/helicase
MPTGLELARHYKAKGYAPLPIAFRSKECRLQDWPNRILRDEELPQFFVNEPQNVAVLLGDASGGLVDVDLDSAEAVKIADRFLPETGCVFGRPSKPRSHRIYRVAESGSTKKFSDPVLRKVNIEIRGNRSCTVYPGSVHPSGEPIEFDRDGEPTRVDRNQLLSAVKELSAACVLARHWPVGSRHDASLALSGCLVSRGLDQEHAEKFMEAVARAAGDEEVADRVACVRTTIERMKRGQKITPTRALEFYFSPEVAAYTWDWLRNQDEDDAVIVPKATELSADGVTPYSDLSNAERFASMHSDKARYCPDVKDWLVWNGSCWSEDKAGMAHRLAIETTKMMALEAVNEARRELLAWAAKSQSARGLRDMLAVAESKIQIRRTALDRDPWVLNCRNGTLDLKAGTLKPHDPADWLSKITRIDFSSRAECPTWHAFLRRVLNEDRELIAFLKRAIGYTLTGVTDEQCLFVMLGNGANGKTTFLRILRSLVGDYAQQTPMDTLMITKAAGVSNDLARLDGTRFVSAVEAEQGKKLAETKIKQMTGGDPIAARYLYGEFFEFVPMFKLWLATNELPRIDGTDEGTWRRIRVIPFEVTIPPEERDGRLGDKLEAELPGILNWALEGCLEWQRDGLKPPQKVMAATKAYRSDMDLLAQFLEDACVAEAGAKVSAKELYIAYQEWCADNGHDPLAQTSLGHRLKAKGFAPTRTRNTRGWSGLRLRNAADEVQAG